MGERTKEALRVHFDARVRLEMHGATLTSEAGLLACRELDDALGLPQAAPHHLEERRSGRHGPYPLASLLRQSVYSRLAGDEDTNDAERLAGDPAMRAVTDRLVSAPQAASTNTLGISSKWTCWRRLRHLLPLYDELWFAPLEAIVWSSKG